MFFFCPLPWESIIDTTPLETESCWESASFPVLRRLDGCADRTVLAALTYAQDRPGKLRLKALSRLTLDTLWQFGA
ncbi:MAG: hypothetical protein ACLR5S_08655 [Ruminococcus sp.]